jgi:transcriptional regulator with XRE-family HTH domain
VGRKAQKRPKRLARKLVLIREREGVTQAEMATRLKKHGAEKTTHSGYVADFESGRRIPSLFTLLAYSRLAKVSTDFLIDDALDLTI